ncbi:MAG: hypothetical protein IJZ27_06975 [Treponema sp.]|nr:hypothetical protein [Treponema sp.]
MGHDFRYLSKKEAKQVKGVLRDIIHEVQDIVREKFTFQYQFIGSASRNMITYEEKGNKGFDFDVNFHVNDDDENYSAEEIRNALQSALNDVVGDYRYSYPEDSTRVLTIKFIDYKNSKIKHSCDFAIVYDCEDGRQQYVRFNKQQRTYTWEFQPKGYKKLPQKMDWLKGKGLWGDLREYYIEKKNKNTNLDKKSRAIFAEAVNEMCQKNGY